MRRRLAVVGATVAVFALVLGMAQLGGRKEQALLYAGLEGAAAGEVIAALDQRGIAYEVRGDSIYVEAAARDATRMALAAEGLPATGGGGYELLDGLSGFGTTSQMFDAAYWRAKEGELARTILANPAIRAARVHIAQAPAQPFRETKHATASVTVTTSGSLGVAQAKALRHLVAAAISGMRPEDVAVIDSVAGLIPLGDEKGSEQAQDRAEELRTRVERLLAARVGAGNAVVEVSLDLVTDHEQITERRFDPQGRVAISTETQEKTGTNRDSAQDVTVASNLPEGDAAAGQGSQSQTSETRERINFEVSETQRELVRGPGGIRRLTVAVLVDGITTTGADGTPAFETRPEAELADLRELVASAVGFDAERGDVLTLKSMAFEKTGAAGTLAEAGFLPAIGPIDVMALFQIAALGLVALVLGLFVIRPLLSGGARPLANEPPLALPVPDALPEGIRVVTGEIDDTSDLPALATIAGDVAEVPDDPVNRLRRLIEERQAESVEILRGWLEDEGERA